MMSTMSKMSTKSQSSVLSQLQWVPNSSTSIHPEHAHELLHVKSGMSYLKPPGRRHQPMSRGWRLPQSLPVQLTCMQSES